MEKEFLTSIRKKAEQYLIQYHSSSLNENRAREDLSKLFYRHYYRLYELGDIWIEPEVDVLIKPILYPGVGYLIEVDVTIFRDGQEEVVSHRFILRPILDRSELIATYLN